MSQLPVPSLGKESSCEKTILCVCFYSVLTCAGACGGQRKAMDFIPQVLPPFLFETSSLTDLEISKEVTYVSWPWDLLSPSLQD